MNNTVDEVRKDKSRLRYSAVSAAYFVGLIWLTWLIDFVFNLALQRFGIYPRTLDGLVGILMAPLIHSSFAHLFSNTLPLLILGAAFLYAYPKSARIGIPAIYIGSGLGVWLFARSSYHIGASGLNHGMMFYLFVIGILRRDRLSMAVSMVVFFLYGGMVWGIFPAKAGISFEYHFFGALLGVCFAVILRNFDVPRLEKRYDWETEPEDREDHVTGEEWRKEEDR